MPSAEYREEELPGLCAGDPRLSWMPMEAFETLGACFHLCAQALAAGETVETAGRIGYLLRGSGVVDELQLLLGSVAEGVAAQGDNKTLVCH